MLPDPHPLEKAFLETISQYQLFQPDQTVLAALSGGADSVLLLFLLQKYQILLKLKNITAFHLNHHLRSEESNADSEFCKNFCFQNHIPFILADADVKKLSDETGLSLEEAARDARYQAFTKAAIESGSDKIATAHNLDDLTETMLFRIFKGTGLPALSGIPVKRGNIVRPLLFVSKADILNYLNIEKQAYRTDSSNSDNRFDRNFIRNEIMPLISSRFPVFREKSASLYRIINEEEDFWKQEISGLQKYAHKEPGYLRLDKELFQSKTHPAVIRRFLRDSIKNVSGSKTYPAELLLKNIEEEALKIDGNKALYADKYIRIDSSYQSYFLYNESKNFPKQTKYVKLKDAANEIFPPYSIQVSIYNRSEKLESRKEDSGYVCYIKDIPGSITAIRYPLPGDYIQLNGGGHQKLQDLFTDRKVPLLFRKEALVLEIESKVAAVLIPETGFRVSADFYIYTGGWKIRAYRLNKTFSENLK